MIKFPTLQDFLDDIRADLWRKPETPFGKFIGQWLILWVMVGAVFIFLIPATLAGLSLIENSIYYPDWRDFYLSWIAAIVTALAIWFILDRIGVWLKAEANG